MEVGEKDLVSKGRCIISPGEIIPKVSMMVFTIRLGTTRSTDFIACATWIAPGTHSSSYGDRRGVVV